jgi:MFS family permease
MLQSLRQHYLEPVRSFNRAARLYLAMIIIDGVILSGWQLFFNFYVLQSGFTREFLGLVNSMPYAAGLIFGLPLGRLSDAIGRRAAILFGLAASSIFMLGQVTFHDPRLIAGCAFLYGGANMLFILSQAPLMARISDRENRTMLFSLSFGLQTLSGSVGALFAGQLPGTFGFLLRVDAHSALAYQAVLITSILLGTTCLIPIWMMKETRPASTGRRQDPNRPDAPRISGGARGRARDPGLIGRTIKLTGPQILIGFGASILIPYMNVFFKDRFNISDSLLGLLFSLSSLLIGIGSIFGPRLSTLLGSKIRAVTVTQGISLVFLLMIGFSPVLWISALGYLVRTALMNMSSPLYSAFCMERTPEENQGFVNSVLTLAWNLGWAIGPFISGIVQQRFGFRPLFIATTVLYAMASALIWLLFRNTESGEPLPEPAVLQSLEYRE